ncbi:PAS domain-containing sensor histidine kinase [Syntrophus aciditrophicus]|uniref:PAS domain-containing sensor histidine kinase n=1 Tax=Syntrophus aciditrophicus TaxID=316277 RepID=UPI00130516B5|nr:PAS domain S-box protein [Syntrophus aciditrophicus]
MRSSQQPALNSVQDEIHPLLKKAFSENIRSREHGRKLRKNLPSDENLLNRYKVFFDSAPVGCIIINEKGYIRHINGTGAAMLNSSDINQLQGKSFFRFISREDRLMFLAHLKSCSESGTNENIEVHLRTWNRQPHIPVQIHTVFHDADPGSKPFFLSVITNISEHKQMEEALRRSEACYRHIVEDHTEMICSCLRNWKITFVNEAMCNVFGTPRDEFIGMPLVKFIDKQDRKKVKELLASLNSSNPIKTVEHRVVMPDGQSRWHRWIHRVIYNRKGLFVEYQSAGRDITEQKETQEALLKAHSELEQKVGERTAELARINETLREEIAEHKETQRKFLASHEQLRALTSDLITTEERERRLIATELHDHIGQTLAVTRIKLEMLHALASYSGFAEALEEIQGFVKQAIQETRSLMTKLSPPVFYELGLTAALEWLVQHFDEQHNLKIVYKGMSNHLSLKQDIQILLLQATRELLMNVVKHAGVEKAEVILKANRKQIQIDVIDHGSGFDVSQIGTPVDWRGGFGIFSIHERLKNLGGELQIRSKRGKGTHFTLIAPHNTRDGN